YPGAPSNLVGIASDDVRAVDLSIDGVAFPVSLRNNVVFGEYPSTGRHAEMTIRRKDGTTSTVRVQLEPSVGFEDIRQARARLLGVALTSQKTSLRPRRTIRSSS